MLSRIALVLLAMTSLAPVAVIYGITAMGDSKHQLIGPITISGALLSVLLCLGLLRYAARHTPPESLAINKSKSADKDVLSFLVAYLLPLISKNTKTTDTVALVFVIGILFVVIYQAQLLNVNPLLGILGYHFFEITSDSGQTHLLLTGRRTVTSGRVDVIKLSENLWFEAKK